LRSRQSDACVASDIIIATRHPEFVNRNLK
jgi:hypothetical protein